MRYHAPGSIIQRFLNVDNHLSTGSSYKNNGCLGVDAASALKTGFRPSAFQRVYIRWIGGTCVGASIPCLIPSSRISIALSWEQVLGHAATMEDALVTVSSTIAGVASINWACVPEARDSLSGGMTTCEWQNSCNRHIKDAEQHRRETASVSEREVSSVHSTQDRVVLRELRRITSLCSMNWASHSSHRNSHLNTISLDSLPMLNLIVELSE